MRILQLYINNNLEGSINWAIVEDENTEKGSSSWDEISLFDNVQVEVYLNAHCCSIMRVNTTGISTKRLTEELILGMLEDSIVDDIDEVKPIILHTENDITYVAIFNKLYYEALLSKLESINKPIRFIQSFVFSTDYQENTWTLYISEEQRFIRTSKYEYYLLDNNQPIPALLNDMLNTSKPRTLITYSDNNDMLNEITTKYDIPCEPSTLITSGVTVWNFHNPKSTHFKIKLEKQTKLDLLKLYNTVKIFGGIIITFWIINLIAISVNSAILEAQLKKNLQVITPIKTINQASVQLAIDKIQSMRHERGVYSETDAVPMFSNFLDTVSNVGTNSIIQIAYAHNSLDIFLNNNFETTQFVSYKNILLTKQILATIQDYKTYLKKIKTSSTNNTNAPTGEQSQELDAAWVITLQPSIAFDPRGDK